MYVHGMVALIKHLNTLRSQATGAFQEAIE